jgi:hypothetical protein
MHEKSQSLCNKVYNDPLAKCHHSGQTSWLNLKLSYDFWLQWTLLQVPNRMPSFFLVYGGGMLDSRPSPNYKTTHCWLSLSSCLKYPQLRAISVHRFVSNKTRHAMVTTDTLREEIHEFKATHTHTYTQSAASFNFISHSGQLFRAGKEQNGVKATLYATAVVINLTFTMCHFPQARNIM